MNIKVKLTKEENANFYGVAMGSIIDIPFEQYLCGVVASEIGAAYSEACKAQAVACRTFAYPYVQKNIAIPDTSSSAQAFRAQRMNDKAFFVAHRAVKDTQGEMLYYDDKLVSPCSFSASNGGKTVSSESRWGSHRPYLIEQEDVWDYAATHGEKYGHGVGMSQRGALYAAKTGVSYRDILSFYYPGTYIDKEEMPMAQVKASALVPIFKQMADEKWKYVAGAHKQGEVDCSGAFYYAYKKLGGYMYHGSNTMWRRYTSKKGKIGEIDLVPGMAVFKYRKWDSSQSSNGWYETDPGDVYHVGMYIGDGLVIEAKGKKYGVVMTNVNAWHLAAQLKDTIYDLSEKAEEEPDTPFTSRIGVVSMSSGWLNLRKEMNVNSERMGKLYNGDVVTIVGAKDDWYSILHNSKIVYVKNKYIKLVDENKKQYVLSIAVFGEDELARMKEELISCGYKPAVIESGVAA